MNSTLLSSSTTLTLSQQEQEHLLEKLEVFKIQGRDKRGRQVVRVIGKIFPGRLVSKQVLKKYLEEKIFPQLKEDPFTVVYVHTGAQTCENFPGIYALRSIYDAFPMNVRDHLEAVYFLHPTLQTRLFLATFGRLLFNGGLYRKLRYVTRLEFLWEHVRRKEIEIPEFVNDHDAELEYRPLMMTTDYGLESDHPRIFCAPADSSVSMYYSMRCIA
ncbi:hypothetical protein LWI29_002704 [Acer saccharum]|uniref:CRAL-TRIO domain-containing protein n=1 Tax=Acer saccharum TaxID=4024 RepID=A0AA39RJX4_ACESA|nr:hypothetical protein LWI29_002704 [Acer saccharum]KAK1555967.1 hypothetical protein Q3G72_033955 [Acer saccharum]